MRRGVVTVVFGLALPVVVSGVAEARDPLAKPREVQASASSDYDAAAHRTGRLEFTISNLGSFGNHTFDRIDCFTGEPLAACEYPDGSGASYFYGGMLWIGGVVGEDTLVSTGADGWAIAGRELHPDDRGLLYRSRLDPNSPAFDSARADQEYQAVYFDTCRSCLGVSYDYFDERPHLPLPIEIVQRSYSWAYPHTEDFVLLDFTVRNIGVAPIHSAYFGIFMDHDINAPSQNGYEGAVDDITGFMSRAPAMPGAACSTEVHLNLAWMADNDGDLWRERPMRVPHVTGLRLLGANDGRTVSYNWWRNDYYLTQDYGPQARVSFRYFGTGGMGTPEGDRNKYHVLSNAEQDFDQYRITAIANDDTTWVPPPEQYEQELSLGMDARYLLSVGPIDLAPGQTESVAFAFVAGENLHTDVTNVQHLPGDPAAYEAGLNFSDFTANAFMAEWVYDNPGVDTDGDGWAGEYVACGDSIEWITGDGVPDWSPADILPAPDLQVEPLGDAIKLRWYGLGCETAIDWFQRQRDFEGYHVYLSTSIEGEDFARVASCDIEDYYRYEWAPDLLGWRLTGHIFGFEEAVCLFAPNGCVDLAWYPDDYTRQAPYQMAGHPDSIFYFVQLGANAHRFGVETPIVKRYPDAPRPSAAILQHVPEDSAAIYLTPEGHFKYFEYELMLDGLIPDRTYRVAVTAHDFGRLRPQGSGLESSRIENMIAVMPQGTICCAGNRGNVDCSAGDEPTVGDIVRLVDFLFISGEPLCCVAEADVNGSGGAAPTADDITLGDVSLLINYLFVGGNLPGCP